MKKFTTKLLMSIIAVAFAFVALGTSTYAWFSMNTEVAVTGMQVTAKSDSSYLIIGSSNSLTTLRDKTNGNKKTVAMTIEDEAAAVYPAAHRADGDNITLADSTVVTNYATANSVANWYTRIADAPTASDSSTAATALSTFDEYVIHKTVYVALAEGSQKAYNLAINTLTITAKDDNAEGATIEPVRVLVASETACQEFAASVSGINTKTNHTATVLDAEVDINEVVKLDIYIYYDGNSTNVFTNNIAKLGGAEIDLTFSVRAND